MSESAVVAMISNSVDEKRSSFERRIFSYSYYIPERRTGEDRRCGDETKCSKLKEVA